MFKYQDVAKVGDRIRAYDFEGRQDCYIEGVVNSLNIEGTGCGFASFIIVVDVDCFPVRKTSSKSRVEQTMYIPMETAWTEYDGRIINLTK